MKKSCLVLAALVAAGCAHHPAEGSRQVPPAGQAEEGSVAAKRNLSAPFAAQHIVKGKTTRKEILEQIGAPNSVDKSVRSGSGAAVDEVWNYWTAPSLQAVGKGGEQQLFRMAIGFDGDGVVKDYQAADTNIVVR